MDLKAILASLVQEPIGMPPAPQPEVILPKKKITNGKNGKVQRRLNVPISELPIFAEAQDYRSSMHWRVFRIMAELMDGWQFLADFQNSIAVFGSELIDPKHAWCAQAEQVGRMLADAGYSVLTEGGPGIAEAANRGADSATDPHKGDSLGLTIKLPHYTRANPYVRKSIPFHYFFIRSLMVSYSARAYIYFPGGLGTLDHLNAMITLVQTKKVSPDIPIILFGKQYWEPLDWWVKEYLDKKFHTIDAADVSIYKIIDSPEEVVEIIKKAPMRGEFFLKD